jgi:hypothetical protein
MEYFLYKTSVRYYSYGGAAGKNYILEIHHFSNNYKHILSTDGASFSSNTCPCFN